jgi:hypothetical protein
VVTSLNSINQLIFLMVMGCDFFEERTEYLNIKTSFGWLVGEVVSSASND